MKQVNQPSSQLHLARGTDCQASGGALARAGSSLAGRELHNGAEFNMGSHLNISMTHRISVQGVRSLGGHFACLRRGFEF